MGLLFHTMATPELDPVGALQLAARLGLDGLELICQENYPCGISRFADPSAVQRIARASSDSGVPIAVLSSYEKRFADPDADVRSKASQALLRELDLAAVLSASGIRLLAAEEPGEGRWNASLERIADALRGIAEEAAKRKIQVLLENHMDTMATSATRTMAICSAADHENLKILFDPANLATLHAEGFLEAFELQKELIAHIHVKDAIVVDGARRSVVPGEGNDPWPALFAALRNHGYDGHYSLEYERRWIAELPPAEIALPKAKMFIERCLAAVANSASIA
jgi:sugar phosphate isomerase/epimerase